jgi:hypothetical protein
MGIPGRMGVDGWLMGYMTNMIWVCPKVVYTSILELFMAISMGIFVQTMGFWGTQWYPDDVLSLVGSASRRVHT